MKKVLIFTVIVLCLLFASVRANVQKEIMVLRVEGAIGPVVTRYILRNVEDAEQENAVCLIIELDTPGGIMESMDVITKALLNAKIPIVVYVTPPGAKAASAGTFIVLSAHIAAMAPATFLGAAHPVQMGRKSPMPGGEKSSDEVLMEKVTNAAVTQIENICRQRGRDPSWAKRAVSESITSSAEELLKLKVIDILAKDRAELIEKLNGRKITINGREKPLELTGASVRVLEMSLSERFLHHIANPNIALILLSLGTLALIQEFATPGIGIGGIAGGIFLILALFSLHLLPVNLAGILLFLFGIILLILEIRAPSFGLLTVGGVTSMILGSFMLIDTTKAPFYTISWQVVLGITLSITCFILFAVSRVIRIYPKRAITGREGLVDKIGYAKSSFEDGKGTIYVDGAYWTGVSQEQINEGNEIIVTAVDGRKLRVKKKWFF